MQTTVNNQIKEVTKSNSDCLHSFGSKAAITTDSNILSRKMEEHLCKIENSHCAIAEPHLGFFSKCSATAEPLAAFKSVLFSI